jgi:hypothetical protein
VTAHPSRALSTPSGPTSVELKSRGPSQPDRSISIQLVAWTGVRMSAANAKGAGNIAADPKGIREPSGESPTHRTRAIFKRSVT